MRTIEHMRMVKAKLEILFYNEDAFLPGIIHLIDTAHHKYRPDVPPCQPMLIESTTPEGE